MIKLTDWAWFTVWFGSTILLWWFLVCGLLREIIQTQDLACYLMVLCTEKQINRKQKVLAPSPLVLSLAMFFSLISHLDFAAASSSTHPILQGHVIVMNAIDRLPK